VITIVVISSDQIYLIVILILIDDHLILID